ncbi:MAG: hypothetical protein FWE09_00445 [Treponema sp.]|nr:hypothetical protein [Treponema sp.]
MTREEISTARVEPHEIAKSDDFEHGFQSAARNAAAMERIMVSSESHYLLGGEAEAVPGKMALSFGPFWANGPGIALPAHLSEASPPVELSPAKTLPRLDTAQARGIFEDFDRQRRAFFDPEIKSVAYQSIDTKSRLVAQIAIKQGEEGSLRAPDADEGWIKIAEIAVAPSAASLKQQDIRGITARRDGEENSLWTAQKSRTFRLRGVASLVADMLDEADARQKTLDAAKAYADAKASSATPLMDGAATAGSSGQYARGDHRHPVDTSRASTSAATESAAGLMSAADKVKLNGVASGATANAPSAATPLMDGAGAVGTSAQYARGDHRHPVDTSRASTSAATESTAGLMSAADKVKLDGVVSTWATIATGALHSLGIRSDGTLWSWGSNSNGQLGRPSSADRVPRRVGSASDWIAVAAGFSHGLGIRADGSLWAWGNNGNGQLGDGTTTQRGTPTRIGSPSDWVAVFAGQYCSFGIRANGTLWAWGYNANNQLGDGTITQRSTPTQVGTASDWVAVAAGEAHSFGIRANGTLWGWGINTYNQLGDGTTTQRSTPTQVGTASDWAAVAAGALHSLGIRSDGTLWAWGYNQDGFLGDGTSTRRTTPTRIGNASDWVAVAAGYMFSLGIRSNGTLWAWGYNTNGIFGDGTTTQRSTPTRSRLPFLWKNIVSSSQAAFGIRYDDTLWAWGNNQEGSLGDGTTTTRLRPVRVKEAA